MESIFWTLQCRHMCRYHWRCHAEKLTVDDWQLWLSASVVCQFVIVICVYCILTLLCEYCRAAWMCIFSDITPLDALYLVCNSDSLLGFLTHLWAIGHIFKLHCLYWMLVLLDVANLSPVLSCDSRDAYSDALQPVHCRYHIFCSDFCAYHCYYS